jgi:group II intron reverse transcriptase/maturase
MARLAERIEDKVLLKLIRAYLKAGVMDDGLVRATEEGTPQGGPLSPLLSNIVLDELDKELEKRKLRFVRFADDCNIYVKTWKAGQRVMSSVSSFIEQKLRLRVNQAKSAVDRPWKRKFLGFTFSWDKENPRIRIAPQSLQRVKAKIRTLTSRSRSTPMEIRIRELNQYLMGWCGYYALIETKSVFQELDAWTRRRLRMCKWKQWKLPKTRTRELISLGVPKHKAYEWGNTRKKYWRIALSPILSQTLSIQYWKANGLQSLTDRYTLLRNRP